MTAKSVLQRTLALFVIGLAALAVIVGATVWLLARTATHTGAVVAAREVRTVLVDLKSLVQDAEIGQRGYLLTGKDSYLAPFDHALTEIPVRLVTLREKLVEGSTLDGQFDDLMATIQSKLGELSRTVDLARAGQRDAALAIVDSDEGKALMDSARSFFDALIAEADARFAENVALQRQTAGTLRLVAFLGALVILAVVGGAALTVRRYTRELTAAQVEIAGLNIGLEEKVQERTRDLARANDEIQRFAYIVTHDLRAPLVNIMGFTSELEASLTPIQDLVTAVESEGRSVPEARLSASEDLPEAIGFIRSSTQKMDGLINAILKLSRDGRRELKPEKVALAPLFAASAAAVQHQVNAAEGEITITTEVAEITSDRISLEQIIGNLLDNAVKYADASRPLRIDLRALNDSRGWMVIELADNGRGIADHDHDRIFELFRRSGVQDKAGEGLGLAYVQASIRNLGGTIALTSRLGEGTTFRISLPRDLRAVIRSRAK